MEGDGSVSGTEVEGVAFPNLILLSEDRAAGGEGTSEFPWQ